VTGALRVTGAGGALTTTSSAQIAGTLTATSNAVIGTDLSVGGTLTASSSAQIAGTLTATSNAVIGTDLSVGGAVSIGGSNHLLTGTILTNLLKAIHCTAAVGDANSGTEKFVGYAGSLFECCYKTLTNTYDHHGTSSLDGYRAGCSIYMPSGNCYAESSALSSSGTASYLYCAL